jgi:hypothetical protein
MSKLNSKALRRIAEAVADRISGDGDLPDILRPDLTTSLVRQWITYDRHATLFVGDRQIYFSLAITPSGGYEVNPQMGTTGWLDGVKEDWKINPDCLADIVEQLNLGQSAETTNMDGIPVRLWVNPKERSRGVEPLVKEPVPPGHKRDYHKIAGCAVKQHLSTVFDDEELEGLCCSVAKQWQRYEGHACLFINEEQQIAFTLTEQQDGGCLVAPASFPVNLAAVFASLGIDPEIVPQVIARINLGQEVEFEDKKAVPSILWHDPKCRRIFVRPVSLRSP